MNVSADLRLAMAATPESLALVRQALAGLADAVGLDDRALADLKQVATELCKNVVVHAYREPAEGQIGRFELDATMAERGVELRVRDWGSGFEPRPADRPGGSLRLGLPLVSSMTSEFLISTAPGGGTEVRATVPAADGDAVAAREARLAEVSGTAVDVAVDAAQPVIARVIAISAARAGLSLDQLSDSVLLGDAIAAHTPGDFSSGRPALEVDGFTDGLVLRVGPFVDGGAGRMVSELELPGLGGSLGTLANSVEIESLSDGRDVVVIAVR